MEISWGEGPAVNSPVPGGSCQGASSAPLAFPGVLQPRLNHFPDRQEQRNTPKAEPWRGTCGWPQGKGCPGGGGAQGRSLAPRRRQVMGGSGSTGPGLLRGLKELGARRQAPEGRDPPQGPAPGGPAPLTQERRQSEQGPERPPLPTPPPHGQDSRWPSCPGPGCAQPGRRPAQGAFQACGEVGSARLGSAGASLQSHRRLWAEGAGRGCGESWV